MSLLDIRRNVAYTMAANCAFCLHIGGTALYFGTKPGRQGPRLELFTEGHRFRWHNPRKRKIQG